MKKCRSKALKALRAKFPDHKWKAQREGFQWGYISDLGWHAGWRSCLMPRYDGDDDSFTSRFYVYKIDECPEEVFF